MGAFRGIGEVFWGRTPRTFIAIALAVLIGGVAEGFAVEITVDSPMNTTITVNTSDLNFTTNESANITYNWDGEGNISGCRNCTSYNTTYGENNGSDANLTAIWHMNENTGTTIYDETSNNNDGTLVGGASWAPGKFGYGVKLDGSTGGINVSYDSSLDIIDNNNPFAFGVWFKLDRNASEAGSNNVVLSQQDGGGSGRTWLQAKTADDKLVSFIGNTLTSNTLVVNDTWYFVVVTYNGSDISMYVNGTLDASVAAGTVDNNANGTYLFGRSKGLGFYFNGTIDEPMFFNRNLSAAEIQDLYDRSLSEGQHNVTVYANDSAGNLNSTTRWFTVNTTSWLNVSLLYPNAENKNVVQNDTFWVNATVTCEGSGSCGVVNGTVRYNSTGEPDKVVNDSSGAKPFYVVGVQTSTCGTLGAGETCQLNWTVNATGDIGNLYVMDVNFSNATGLSNNTGNAEKNITVATEYTRTLYVTTDWNWIAWPYAETPIEEALENISGLYESVWYRNGSLSDGDSSWCWYKESIGSKAGCDFYTLKPGREYQVNITTETNFTMSGALQSVNLTFTNTYSLSKWRESFGWLYSATSVYDAVASVEGSYKSIWYWNDSENKWYGAYKQAWSQYNSQLESSGYGILTTLEPGKGYGFWATNEDTLELSPP